MGVAVGNIIEPLVNKEFHTQQRISRSQSLKSPSERFRNSNSKRKKFNDLLRLVRSVCGILLRQPRFGNDAALFIS